MNQIHSGPRLMVYHDEPKKISPKHSLDENETDLVGKEGGGHLTARVREIKDVPFEELSLKNLDGICQDSSEKKLGRVNHLLVVRDFQVHYIK